ncbi:MFS transporter [Gammaproteobacteria bacterium SCGC AG-212-F23]|nr:MFS transporter [Gammaproteobacteria bacterium SCGC AG-212-F23]
MQYIQKKNPDKYFLAILALFIVPISGVSIDIYVPSLPQVSHFFGVDKSIVQLTITAYTLGLGLMQIFAGPVSDSFGRRKPFLISMSIFIITTLMIPWSHTIHQLLLLRFIQGAMVAATVVPMRSVIADLFEGQAYYKMMTYMTNAWSIGPIIAPAIGGYLQHYIGWQANFYFLAIYGIIGLALIWIYMPETSMHIHPFNLREIFQRYRSILFNKKFISSVTMNGFLYTCILLFAVLGPFLIQTMMHYSAVQFGHMALLTGLAWFLGTVINRILIHIPLEEKSTYCLWTMLIIALAMLGLSFVYALNIYVILIPVLMLLLVGGIAFPNYFARGVALFPQATGSSNALFGSAIFLISSVGSAFAVLLKSTSSLPLAAAYVGLVVVCLIIHSIELKS